MDRKGSYDISRKTLYFILVLFVLTFIFLYMSGTIQKYYGLAIENRDAVMAHIISAEAMFSPRCFAYYDETTGRAYPGVIDADKFKQPLNEWCLRYADAPYAIYFDAGAQDKKVIASGPLLQDTETVKRYILGVKDGMLMTANPSLSFEFNDYYVKEWQRKQITGEEMARAIHAAELAVEEIGKSGP